jgi:succinoglycan biosynthesis protein ExoM
LIRRSFLDKTGLAVLPELGVTGGEDTVFFGDAAAAGARFSFNADAVVYEEVPVGRQSLAWLVQRRFRSGQTHFFAMRRQGDLRFSSIAAAAAKTAYCGGAAMLGFYSKRRVVTAILRGALHVGFIASALGHGTHQEYRSI